MDRTLNCLQQVLYLTAQLCHWDWSLLYYFHSKLLKYDLVQYLTKLLKKFYVMCIKHGIQMCEEGQKNIFSCRCKVT